MYTSVLVVDKSIDHTGILTNVGLVLGLTAGRLLPDSTFGHDIVDGDGNSHRYLTNMPQSMRKAGQNKLRSLREYFGELPEVTLVDYTESAAVADYPTYEQNLTSRAGDEISYRAIYIYGPHDIVYPKTKNLSALG